MSRPQRRPRGPPGDLRAFSSVQAVALSAKKSGFGGFETARSRSGLAYLTERPDLADIADANAVVLFKNLFKKDSVTKARALEDLVAYAQAHPNEDGGGVEEAILDAWVQCYPRLAVDNERKVRELAHALQLALLQSARRRMERLLPRVAGAWLAGAYDRDRGVAKAAADGLASLLTTPDKTRRFWVRLQASILAYAAAAVQETPKTLSDLRATSRADADLKHARVVYGSLSLVLVLLRTLDTADLAAQRDAYTAFLALPAVADAARAADSHVRAAAYELVLQCLETQPTLVLSPSSALPRLTVLLTTEAPSMSQAGALVVYLRLLQKLSELRPDIWDDDSAGADGHDYSHPYMRLLPLVKRGSQGTPATAAHSVWTQLDGVFASIPVEGRSISADEAGAVLAAFRTGLAQKDEPQGNAVDGWTAYLSVVRRLIDVLEPATEQAVLVEHNVFPLLQHYMHHQALSSSPPSIWATGAKHLPVLTRASLLVSRPAYVSIVAAAHKAWAQLAADFSGRMAGSLPETSKEHQASQHAVAAEGERWFALAADIHRAVLQVEAAQRTAASNAAGASTTGTSNLVEDVLLPPTVSILQSAQSLLAKRNYKPFGLAEVVRAALEHAPHLLGRSDEGRAAVEALFPVDDAERLALLLSSPSISAALSCLRAMASIPEFHETYERSYAATISALLASRTDGDDDGKTAQHIALLLSDASDIALATSRRNASLQAYLSSACLATAQGKTQHWGLFKAVFASQVLTQSEGAALAAEIVRSLDRSGSPSGATSNQASLAALETIASRAPALLATDEGLHLELVTKLLGMMEVHDTAQLAKVHALYALVSGSTSKCTKESPLPLMKIIQSNLETAGPESLVVDTLVVQALSIANASDATPDDRESLFPNSNVWMGAMQAFFNSSGGGLDASLALTSDMGGAYLLVPAASAARSLAASAPRDHHGSTVPARMAAYLTKLLAADGCRGIFTALPHPFQFELLFLLYLVAELGADQIALADAHSLWGDLSASDDLSAAAEDAVAGVRTMLAGAGILQDRSLVEALVAAMLRQTRTLTPLGVYAARSLSGLLQAQADAHHSWDEESLARLDLWRTPASHPETTLGALAVLAGRGELLAASKTVSTFCNRLLSEVAAARPGRAATLPTLVLLNACAGVYEAGQVPAATNRVVFAVKQITSWFGGDEDEDDTTEEVDSRLAAESCRALQRLLPCIKDIYGPYWERGLRFAIGLWDRAVALLTSAEAVPTAEIDACLVYVHASLKLVAAIEAVTDANDDLEDARALFSDAKWTGLRRLLLAVGQYTTGTHRSARIQPQDIVDRLLGRMAGETPLSHLLKAADDLPDLYGLLASPSRALQAAGFGLLHRALPAQQAELAVETLLEKRDARLPDALLSLLLGAPPTLEAYPDDVLATFPLGVRAYLLAWRLVFDAFSTASAKVRGDYAEQLAGQGAAGVAALLDFACDVLGHSAAHPLNLARERLAAREAITAYDVAVGDGEPDEWHMHWLLVHLYYLVLKYVPGLFRTWYAACRSRQTTVAVEAWTAKYVSGLLMDEVLDDVEAWAASQDDDGGGGGDDNNLLVKVNRRAHEVVAGYEVDDVTMSIALRLPANYPIDNVAVVGLNRVAVDERKWDSWLMVTQGVIAFSNGSLVEGLAAFRRNVLGALRGQTECAICYSIISADRRMPDKRCGTCKNLFHKSCLFKWFQSSNQNSCPLCRNPISFLGSDTRGRRAHGDE